MEPVTARGISTTSRPAPIHRCTSSQKRRSLASGVMGGELSTFGAIAVILANANNSQRQAFAGGQPSPWAAVDLQVTKSAQPSVSAMTVLKPFMMVACVAFVAGFMGYLAVARMATPTPQLQAQAPQDSWSSDVSAP